MVPSSSCIKLGCSMGDAAEPMAVDGAAAQQGTHQGSEHTLYVSAGAGWGMQVARPLMWASTGLLCLPLCC